MPQCMIFFHKKNSKISTKTIDHYQRTTILVSVLQTNYPSLQQRTPLHNPVGSVVILFKKMAVEYTQALIRIQHLVTGHILRINTNYNIYRSGHEAFMTWPIYCSLVGRGCLVTWSCYQMIAKPGNKTFAPSWPDQCNLRLQSYKLILVWWSIKLYIFYELTHNFSSGLRSIFGWWPLSTMWVFF